MELRATLVVDLGFGDAGKGTLVDWLVRTQGASLVVRWNGGAQAGHTVVLDDGRAHTFAQFGAGSFVPGVRTHLSEHVVVHPTALLVEARHLAGKGVTDALDRLTVAAGARLITPFHQAANRLRELARGQQRHGTCGVGVGEAVRDALEHPDDALRAGDLMADAGRLRARLARVRERVRASLADVPREVAPGEWAVLDDASIEMRWLEAIAPLVHRGVVVPDDALGVMLRDTPVVFEGAQGVLLDEHVGFHPHTTWTTCTPGPAVALLRDNGWRGTIERLGVLRTYATRHGTGPFPTEDRALSARLPEPHNPSDGWQGTFRAGWPDPVLARYARDACGGVDALALTHCDRLDVGAPWKGARAYGGVPEALAVHDARGDAIALRTGDLAHQERLARALQRCDVVYEQDLPQDREGYVQWFEQAVGIAVKITSDGPTTRAKRVRGGLG